MLKGGVMMQRSWCRWEQLSPIKFCCEAKT